MSGRVFRVERAHGPVWYAKYRLPDGREVQHNIGPAWTGCGRPAGYFTKRLADDWLRDVVHEARRRTLAGPGHGCREATGEPRRRHRRVLAEEVYALVGAAASEQDAAIFLTAAFAASTTATDFRPRAYLASLYVPVAGSREQAGPPLLSLDVIASQVASERETMNAHAESLDTKAGVVLGFAGVLVGLGATAQTSVSSDLTFQIGLGVAVAAALAAALAFLPRKYPVVEVLRLREFLTATENETKLTLLDVQIHMVIEAATLVRRKGQRVKTAVALLAVATALVVAGTRMATGGATHHV